MIENADCFFRSDFWQYQENLMNIQQSSLFEKKQNLLLSTTTTTTTTSTTTTKSINRKKRLGKEINNRPTRQIGSGIDHSKKLKSNINRSIVFSRLSLPLMFTKWRSSSRRNRLQLISLKERITRAMSKPKVYIPFTKRRRTTSTLKNDKIINDNSNEDKMDTKTELTSTSTESVIESKNEA